VTQLMEKQRAARTASLNKQLECGCPDSTASDKPCIHQQQAAAAAAAAASNGGGRKVTLAYKGPVCTSLRACKSTFSGLVPYLHTLLPFLACTTLRVSALRVPDAFSVIAPELLNESPNFSAQCCKNGRSLCKRPPKVEYLCFIAFRLQQTYFDCYYAI
jgi:hypothetical protein